MISRRLLLLALGSTFVLAITPTSAKADKKKPNRNKGPDKKKPDAKKRPEVRKPGNQDGKDNVAGAVWVVEAENLKTGDKKQFRFRAKDGTLFNVDGKSVGGLRHIGTSEQGGTKSRMYWKAPLPLEGEIVITLAKRGIWGGTLKTESGDEWRCRLVVADR
jgi:hypothetical protein